MVKKLVIIHTTPATIEPLKKLAREYLGDIEVFDIVDDSILPELKKNGGKIEEVEGRWEQYAKIASEHIGADCILNACSSIGELVERVQPKVSTPIVRIDERMAEYAVKNAEKIGIAATLPTTLNPTLRLLQEKAEKIGKNIDFETVLVESAYQKLMQGDKEGHDKDLAISLRNLVPKNDLVVLAQASMASVVATFSPEEQQHFITSPELGMEAVKELLEK